MGLGKRSETSLELGRGGARDAVRLRTPAASGASSPSDERDGERGSILLLFALFITLFALLCAVVVDVGYWWVIGKKAQVAADACALAAAQSIPTTNPTGIECVIDTGGPDYVLENLPVQDGTEPLHTGTEVEWPYVNAQGASNPSEVEATVHLTVRTFFGRVVGLDHISLTRRAVAEKSQGAPGNYAIYSHSSSCSSGLEFDGNNRFINGLVHSNGQYLIGNSGSPFWAKEGTRAVPGCGPAISNAIRFGGTSWATATPGAPTTVGAKSWPEWFTPGDFTCTVNAQKIEISGSDLKINGVNQPYPTVGGQKVIPNGTYCATELFQVSGNDIRGQLTVLSPKIEVNGNNIDLTSLAPNGVLFYNLPNITPGGDGGPGGVPAPACSPISVEMKLSNGNESTWKGKVFHPCERVLIDGNGTSSVEGAIYGLRVKVNGNGFNMIGTGGSGGVTAGIGLVE